MLQPIAASQTSLGQQAPRQPDMPDAARSVRLSDDMAEPGIDPKIAIFGHLNDMLVTTRSSDGLMQLADLLNRVLGGERRDGETEAQDLRRLSGQLSRLSPQMRAAVEQLLSQSLGLIKLSAVINALADPAGPIAARLTARLEGRAEAGQQDPATRSVVTLYQQNNGEGRTAAAPREIVPPAPLAPGASQQKPELSIATPPAPANMTAEDGEQAPQRPSASFAAPAPNDGADETRAGNIAGNASLSTIAAAGTPRPTMTASAVHGVTQPADQAAAINAAAEAPEEQSNTNPADEPALSKPRAQAERAVELHTRLVGGSSPAQQSAEGRTPLPDASEPGPANARREEQSNHASRTIRGEEAASQSAFKAFQAAASLSPLQPLPSAGSALDQLIRVTLVAGLSEVEATEAGAHHAAIDEAEDDRTVSERVRAQAAAALDEPVDGLRPNVPGKGVSALQHLAATQTLALAEAAGHMLDPELPTAIPLPVVSYLFAQDEAERYQARTEEDERDASEEAPQEQASGDGDEEGADSEPSADDEEAKAETNGVAASPTLPTLEPHTADILALPAHTALGSVPSQGPEELYWRMADWS